VAFDWRQVQLRLDGAAWKLTAGQQTLAGFGSNALNARLALSAMRYYRFTEQRHAGNDPTGPAYYLASAQAPRGVMLGLNAESFQPERVEVRSLDGGFAVADGAHVLMYFGSRQAEAAKLVETIKRQKYDRLCRLGEYGEQGMAMLVWSR
jgi:hypothetical protein